MFRGVCKRSVKLFVLGLVVQGSLLSVGDDGVPRLCFDLSTFRIMGILQRIALAFFLVSTVHLCVPEISSGSRTEEVLLVPVTGRRGFAFDLFYRASLKWAIILSLFALGTSLTYGVRPSLPWPGCDTTLFRCSRTGDRNCSSTKYDRGSELSKMGCSGPGWLDSHILGIRHVYVQGTDDVTTSPNFGFDPEGLITSFAAVSTMFIGLHVGRVWKELQSPYEVFAHWLVVGTTMVAVGSLMSIWVPFNKRLWSPSYNIFMCGSATLVYAALFAACDATGSSRDARPWIQRTTRCFRTCLAPLQWFGENCILFYLLSDCGGGLNFLVRTVSWGGSPKSNLITWFQDTVIMTWFAVHGECEPGAVFDNCGPAVLTYVLVQMVFWVVVLGILHQKGIIYKL